MPAQMLSSSTEPVHTFNCTSWVGESSSDIHACASWQGYSEIVVPLFTAQKSSPKMPFQKLTLHIRSLLLKHMLCYDTETKVVKGSFQLTCQGSGSGTLIERNSFPSIIKCFQRYHVVGTWFCKESRHDPIKDLMAYAYLFEADFGNNLLYIHKGQRGL